MLFFLAFGVLAIWLFHERHYLPISVSTAVIVLVAWYIVLLYRRSLVGPLTALLFLAYALPFVHIVPYIWFNFDTDSPTTLWGLLVNPYMTSKSIIELMSMIGAVGAAGFAVGILLARQSLAGNIRVDAITERPSHIRTLAIPTFCGWILLAISLTWLAAPSDTVFTAKYTESTSFAEGLNFSSAWMFSYAFLVFALADTIFEPSVLKRRVKKTLVLFAILLIVIWFQLLRGDRESLPFVLAAILMYYVWANKLSLRRTGPSTSRSTLMYLSVFAVFLAAYVVGALRHALTEVSNLADLAQLIHDLKMLGVLSIDTLITGTWSAALLTPLSVAGDYLQGSLPLKFGQTYIDLVVSIVPGFIADWVGYARPIDAFKGPAWEMTYGLGGTHAVVVPFTDFRMLGVYVVLGLFSFAITRIERYAVARPSVANLSLLGVIAMAIPHWLWYGEKNIINALVIWAVLAVAYRIRLTKRWKPRTAGSAQSRLHSA